MNALEERVRVERQFCGMELTVLGTASGSPDKFRGLSAHVLHMQHDCFLFDCGESTQLQLAACQLFSPHDVSAVFITHLHGDHIFGLPGWMCTVLTRPVERPLVITGPPGLRRFLDAALVTMHGRDRLQCHVVELVDDERHARRVLKDNATVQLPGSVLLPNVTGDRNTRRKQWTVFESPHARIQAAPLRHSVPCFGYVVQESDVQGNIDVQAASARGLFPGPAYAKLKRGEPVPLPDGTTLYPHEVVSPPRRGRKAVILGDTCDSSAIVPLARDADIVLHEATVVDNDTRRARQIQHSTPGMAGDFARRVNARTLALTHFSGTHSGEAEANMHRFGRHDTRHRMDFPQHDDRSAMAAVIRSAQQTFRSQRVIAARDFMTIPIHHPTPSPRHADPSPTATAAAATAAASGSP